MENTALKTLLAGKKYLLLQGPMGPFFSDMADWLESMGREAVNVVFNGGDEHYCRHRNPLAYRQTPDEFASWLRELYRHYPCDTILCFGDCRPLHRVAARWARSKGIRFLAFEEGYLRPHFITLEPGGVNAHSALPRAAEFYRALPEAAPPVVDALSPSFSLRVRRAVGYYAYGWLRRHRYEAYRHHKSFSPWYEARCWLRAGWRKQWYRVQQRGIVQQLSGNLSQRYYLAILQVYNDSQIRHHSPYEDVRDYINEVMHSFAKKAPSTEWLVLKHHPMDRGHRLYGPLIRRLARLYKIENRVLYVHDLPMPELLTHARGVITINSTAGLSALIHHKPLKVMGRALYDIRGLTFQGHLNQFWSADFQPDWALFEKFRHYLQQTTQINAVFYGENRVLFESRQGAGEEGSTAGASPFGQATAVGID